MIDKKRLLLFNRLTLLVILIFIILISIRISFSSYESVSKSNVVSDIAFYLLDVGTQSEELKLDSIAPDDKDYIYNIVVQNYKDDLISEVDLEYSLDVITTTNIPIDYKIQLKNDPTNIISTKETFQDDDLMYFNKYSTGSYQFFKDKKMIKEYQIIVNFPKKYNDEVYQDLIDSVQVVINSKQLV